MESTEKLMTDAEVAERLRVSLVTLRKHLKCGPPRSRGSASTGDIRKIRHFSVGGQRRWVETSVDEFIRG